MASVPDSSRRFSYLVFSTSSSDRKKKATQQRPSTSHYRPVSTILSQASALQQPPPSFESRPSRNSVRNSTMMQLIKDKSRISFESQTSHKSSLPPPHGSDRLPLPSRSLFSKLKMKRSMSSLNPQQTNDPVPSQLVPSFTMNLSAPDLRKPVTSKDKWIRKDYATFHPYPDEAPYMQAYDPIPLDNDRYTDLLLRRLMPNGSPTFHDYGTKPPQSILDLGCGMGHWVLYAADVWKTSQFIGFDLVDLTSHMEKLDNVTFVKGNFLKQRLPFANKQFDLVRMANLSLCIPHAKWEALLMEVFRILAVGGRLELIDDEIIFPYGPTPESDSKQSKPSVQSVFDDFDDDDDTLEDDSGDTDATLVNEHGILLDRYRGEITPLRLPKSTKRHSDSSSIDDLALVSPTLAGSPTGGPMTGVASTWTHQASESQHLETIFEKMLKAKYDVHSRPSEFLGELVLFVFGRGNAEKERAFHLKLAPKNADEFYGLSASSESREILSDKDDGWSSNSSDSGLGFPPRKRSLTMERKLSQDFSSMSDRVSAKAAGRLGITYSALAAATAASVRQRSQTSPAQSPGLILWPSTYFPMSPSELEMHACKNLHVLLGCKRALAEYVQSFKERDGKNCVEDGVCSDALWEYECFRRRRFHWPTDVPVATSNGIHRRSFPTSWSKSAKSSVCPYTEDELTHIRTIHVYQALKSDDYSMANLQYPRYPVPSPPKPRRFLFR